jgi:hypothetical protein
MRKMNDWDKAVRTLKNKRRLTWLAVIFIVINSVFTIVRVYQGEFLKGFITAVIAIVLVLSVEKYNRDPALDIDMHIKEK